MEDIISLVLRGCKLAQDLESNLGLLNDTSHLLEKCEQIAVVFNLASQGLYVVNHVVSGGPIIDVGPTPAGSSKGKEVIMEVSGGGEVSMVQKTRKRKDESGKRTIEVEAPQHGNTEIPPDDGYTWRKYGQKEILGALFPRGYYRCTHQKLYNCPAKKQVQRLNTNPRIFQVTYRGHHICHMNSTAPTAAIPITASRHDSWLSDLNVGANVVDMADAMFNSSDGSVDDGIDFIFSK